MGIDINGQPFQGIGEQTGQIAEGPAHHKGDMGPWEPAYERFEKSFEEHQIAQRIEAREKNPGWL